jgi:predicted O-methyltransferase YrrM
MPDHTPATADDIRALASAFQRSRVLLTAADLDLFTHLGREWRRASDLAPRLTAPGSDTPGVDVRGLDRLLGALAALGLAAKQGDAYRATDAAFELLSAESPKQMSLGHLSNLYANWGTLTQAVRHGGTVLDPHFDDDTRREHFIAAMHARARHGADALAAMLPLAGARRALDVGGGSGVYSMAMCRAEPGLRAVVLDLPEVARLTEGYVREAGLSERISALPGDMLAPDWSPADWIPGGKSGETDPSGGFYDLVFVSAIAHMFGPEQCAELVRRCFAVLRPGGSLALVDFLMDESRTEPAFGAVFALNMLVNTEAGDAYTESEARGWFTKAGFTDIRCRPASPETQMLLGRRP